jgi:DNA-binding CsgD family transcriptional regulator
MATVYRNIASGRKRPPWVVTRQFAGPLRRLAQRTGPIERAIGVLDRIVRGERRSGVRYGAPALLVLATLGAIHHFLPGMPQGGMFLLLMVPVLVASLTLGLGPGIVALAVAANGAVFVLPLAGNGWLYDATDVLRLLLFAAEGMFIVVVASVLRVALRRARAPATTLDLTEMPTSLVEPLTPREVEVLRLAATGLGAEPIAELLVVSPNTVKTHLAHAYGKLGAHNRAEAISAGLQWGYLDRDGLAAQAPQITLRGDARTQLRA